MKASGIITLTTDFGSTDIYVGAMKGVILSVNPQARIVDLTHEVAPQDVIGGGFALGAAYSFFPAGTVHVAIVDPGVGSARRPLLIETYTHFFIGPDNGIFSRVLAGRDVQQVIELNNPAFFLPVQSATFHGRDIFAPVAAHLSKGVALSRLGTVINDPVIVHVPEPMILDRWHAEGAIVHIDRFGNLITNIHKNFLDRFAGASPFVATVHKKKIARLLGNYAAAKDKELFCIIGSSGLLEVSMNKKSAADYLRARKGDTLMLSIVQ